MFTLRCTGKLLKRLDGPFEAIPKPPTSRLGDFYATLVFARPRHLLLGISNRTLLPVLIPSRELSTMVPRFRSAVADMLRSLGIEEEAIRKEQEAMAEVVFGKTASRQVLGSMNDFIRMLDYDLEHSESLLEASLRLASAPCGPIGMARPEDATRAIFSRTAPISLLH